MMTNHTPQLRLHLLGPPEVRLGEEVLVFATRKTLALLTYLAIEGGLQPRERLATLLWPESSTERSYASLRNTLRRLHTALRQADSATPAPYLTVTHNALALNPDADIDIDLHLVEHAYTQARNDRSSRTSPEGSSSLPLLQSATACHRGDFLAGFSLSDAPAFDDWVTTQTEVWRRRLGLILNQLSEIQFTSGDFIGAAESASRWIALDALNEAAYRRKMRAHFAAGERGQALKTYAACCAVLSDELGVTPGSDTEALATHIRIERPVPLLSLRSNTPVYYLENLFAGRSAEHQALVECYRQAAAGQPQVVILRGEAGIGKTRLAEKFLSWIRAQGAEVLQGSTFESGNHMPFQPLIEALRLWLNREENPKDLLGESWLSLVSQILPEVYDRYPELPRIQLESKTDSIKLFESIVHLTLVLAHQMPLVFFIDDVQWADSGTLDVLQYAIRRWRQGAARIMLLISVRSEALHPITRPSHLGLSNWLDHVERELAPHHLELGPLSEPDTVKMVSSILTSPETDFADWVFHETRGQPFYLTETLKDLLERGALHPMRREGSTWTFAIDAEHDLGKAVQVPSTVRAVIRSRLHRLSPHASNLLVAGAILEQGITFERLCSVSDLPESIGVSALDELASSYLLLEDDGSSLFTFANDMIRDVVLTEAGDARRRLFHKRALDVLEAANYSAAVLGHHALAAGLMRAAFHYSLVAGKEALRMLAVTNAIVHFERAWRLMKEESLDSLEFVPQLRDLYLQLGQAYELDGQHEQALVVYAELAQLPPFQS